jgi:DNA repair protein RecO (recombination protein O)
VINHWLVVKGKRLDKVVQAETIRSFSGLSQHLGRLTTSQYLAEIVLAMALSECSQTELFDLFTEHLSRIEASQPQALMAALCHGLYHLLALGGVAPEVHRCCLSRAAIVPDLLDPQWQASFSLEAGGLVQSLEGPQTHTHGEASSGPGTMGLSLAEGRSTYPSGSSSRLRLIPLTAVDVALLQQLSKPDLLSTVPIAMGSEGGASVSRKGQELWSRIERILRHYAQDYFEQPIRSAALIDVCLTTA